mmetsp:Transcript_17687/g.41036  ORF Transcript_17687/g.41036 Transcript_17687/m.41036 type:complete len:91 (-) Transcript_17687:537-809(-)
MWMSLPIPVGMKDPKTWRGIQRMTLKTRVNTGIPWQLNVDVDGVLLCLISNVHIFSNDKIKAQLCLDVVAKYRIIHEGLSIIMECSGNVS